MPAARPDIHHQEPEFVTLDLRNPAEAVRQELNAQAEGLDCHRSGAHPCTFSPDSRLRHLTIARSSSGGLCLTGLLPSALEFEFEPTHAISVALRQVASQAGGWVETIEFQMAHGE